MNTRLPTPTEQPELAHTSKARPYSWPMMLTLASGLILLGIFAYTLRPMLMAPISIPLAPDTSCDLNREPCRAMLPEGGRLTLSTRAQPIPLLKPFSVNVMVEGPRADKVELDFAGIDMNMGLNRVTLKPDSAGHEFSGEATLPVCVTGGMAWKATVLVAIGRREYALPVLFETGKTH